MSRVDYKEKAPKVILKQDFGSSSTYGVGKSFKEALVGEKVKNHTKLGLQSEIKYTIKFDHWDEASIEWLGRSVVGRWKLQLSLIGFIRKLMNWSQLSN